MQLENVGVSFKASATNPGKYGILNIIGGFPGKTKVYVMHQVSEWPFLHKKACTEPET